MSVIIKDMVLPKCCGECHFCHSENFQVWCCITLRDDIPMDDIPDYCPLSNVVYCGGCINFFNNHLCLRWSKYGIIETKAEDFCSYGERI